MISLHVPWIRSEPFLRILRLEFRLFYHQQLITPLLYLPIQLLKIHFVHSLLFFAQFVENAGPVFRQSKPLLTAGIETLGAIFSFDEFGDWLNLLLIQIFLYFPLVIIHFLIFALITPFLLLVGLVRFGFFQAILVVIILLFLHLTLHLKPCGRPRHVPPLRVLVVFLDYFLEVEAAVGFVLSDLLLIARPHGAVIPLIIGLLILPLHPVPPIPALTRLRIVNTLLLFAVLVRECQDILGGAALKGLGRAQLIHFSNSLRITSFQSDFHLIYN